MDLHPDFRDLLGEFVRAGVRFAVLGGYAVGIHGRGVDGHLHLCHQTISVPAGIGDAAEKSLP